MSAITTDEIDLSFEEALGVWYDLERALEGKNGFGGAVAEIYAYRLVPAQLRQYSSLEKAEEQAPLAGRNLTSILRHFADLHEGVEFAIDQPGGFEVLDLDKGVPPFAHRVHLRVSQDKRVRAVFARKLLALFNRAHEIDDKLPQPDFTAWAGATKDLLLALGLEWDGAKDTYVFRGKP